LHVEHLIRALPNWKFQLYLDAATPPGAAAALLALPNATLRLYAEYRPGDIDLFHIPDPFYRGPGLRSPWQIITDVNASAMLFDLSYLRFDGEDAKLGGQLENIQRLGQLLEPRFRLLTLSEFTRRELLQATDCEENKAAAVLSGLDPAANPKITPAAIRAVRQKYGLKNRMLLHFGPVEKGNHFESVIAAFGQLRVGDLDLVVLGEKNSSIKELTALVREQKVTGIVFPGAIPDAELELLYREALALISLSSRVDYAFNVLDAMAQGCPVITARGACFTELGGEAALFFAPEDIKGIGDSLEKLLGSAPWRRELADKSRARASQFTWEASARKTIAVWEEMLAGARKASAPITGASVISKPDEAASSPPAQSSAAPEAAPTPSEPEPLVSPDVSASGSDNSARNSHEDLPGQPVAVAWEGSYLDFGSLSHVNRELTKELQQQPRVDLTRVVNAKPVNVHPKLAKLARELALAAPRSTQVTVRHGWPPNWSRPERGALVVMQPWEFGALPEEWVRQASSVQEFWVPTEFVRQAFVQSGVPGAKVKVVPNGIDPAVFHPGVRPLKLATSKSFKFLFVGGTIHRKGADVLLQSYLRSFSAKDDVCLVIKDFGTKSFYAGQTLGAQIKAAQAAPGAPEIEYLDGELAPDELPALYTACDCLVHPYRGEGFGLTILEAMACGLPVIITGGGAADEFAGKFAYSVKSSRKTIGPSISGEKLTGPGWLLEPDAAALAERMREVFTNQEEARAKGGQASEHARQEWTWERAARIAAERLRDLQARSEAALDSVSADAPEHPIANGKPAAAAGTDQSEEQKPAASIIPPCALVGQLIKARDLVRSKQLAKAWAATLAAIEARPFHPEAFLLLAEIARIAGDAVSARRCAERACDMAPQFQPARKFLKLKLHGNAKPSWLTLPEAISGQAKPRLSVCMIVKNEEKFLAQCLESVRGLADQIVVVDTGSTDRTVEIAKEHGAEVHSFQWCDDFSAARNAALEHARGDWVLILDADEELPPEQHDALRKLISCKEAIAWRLPIAEVGREEESHAYVPRLFRNAPVLFYVSRVHEQVFGSIELRRREWGLDNRLGDAALRHHGYRPDVMRDRKKVERNLRLLEQALAELPTEPFLLMNYGLELVRSGQPEKGLENYRKAFEVMSVEEPPETRETLLMQYCTQLMRVERYEEVVRVLDSPLAKAGEPNASLHFTLGLAHLKLKQSREAAVQMRRCLEKRHLPSMSSVNQDIHTAAPRYCLALALDQAGEPEAALQEFQSAVAENPKSRPVRLDYARFLAAHNKAADAIKLLFQLAMEKPDDVAVWAQGGRLALSKPEFLEVARNWTAEARRRAPQDPVVLRQRAEALLLSGQCDAALPLWRQLQPGADPVSQAALVICETVVAESQYYPGAELEGKVSHEFLKWYRRLVAYKARTVLHELNTRLEQWQGLLPTAARTLSAALAEAQEAVPA
jgi:glycosyltransferase involved in cell wall biosynthesis/tetratricopeptide (TPR) repeat protein